MRKILIPVTIILLTACNSMDTTPTHSSSAKAKPDIQGHRGARGLMPENTWPTMKTALELGVTTLEMDAVITADSQVVLSHEPWMNHIITTKPDGQPVTAEEEKQLNIYQMALAEVQRYDVGMRPHPGFPRQKKMPAFKPTLGSIFDSVALWMKSASRPFPFFNIETKTDSSRDGIYHPEPAVFCELLMNVIREKQMESWVIIQSFDPRTLRYLHEHYPTIRTALLTELEESADVQKQVEGLGFVPDIYSPAHQSVTREMVDYCHGQKMKLIPWTVNDRARVEELIGWGVDGIITDYPGIREEEKEGSANNDK